MRFVVLENGGLVSEIKQLLRIDAKDVANAEDHIQRTRTIGGFDAAHMRPADVDQLCQLALRDAPLFSVIGDVQTKKSVFFVVLRLHIFHPLFSISISF